MRRMRIQTNASIGSEYEPYFQSIRLIIGNMQREPNMNEIRYGTTRQRREDERLIALAGQLF